MLLHVEIGERAYNFEPRPVLFQSTITNLEKSENLFDDQKWMLNSGSDFRFCAVSRSVNFRQRLEIGHATRSAASDADFFMAQTL